MMLRGDRARTAPRMCKVAPASRSSLASRPSKQSAKSVGAEARTRVPGQRPEEGLDAAIEVAAIDVESTSRLPFERHPDHATARPGRSSSSRGLDRRGRTSLESGASTRAAIRRPDASKRVFGGAEHQGPRTLGVAACDDRPRPRQDAEPRPPGRPGPDGLARRPPCIACRRGDGPRCAADAVPSSRSALSSRARWRRSTGSFPHRLPSRARRALRGEAPVCPGRISRSRTAPGEYRPVCP